jgi:hypothetical protein
MKGRPAKTNVQGGKFENHLEAGMTKKTRRRYTAEFKAAAVARLDEPGETLSGVAQALGVAATHAPRPQPQPGEDVVVMEVDELWHFVKKRAQTLDLAGF